MRKWNLNLRLFDGGAGAAAGGAAGSAGGSAEGTAGAGQDVQILEDGTRMDHRLAERMEKQRKRRNGTGAAGTAAGSQETGNGQAGLAGGQAQGNAQAAGTQPEQAATAKTPEQEFDELIRGKYAEQYRNRIQNTINDRFKNQANLQSELDGLKPMLDALAKKHGIESGDYKALSNVILDDDSLYEEEAEEAGMTVEAYKSYQKLKAHADEMDAREKQSQQEMAFRNHVQKLAAQGEQMKQTFPDFDLMKELQNDAFRRMTAPDVGLSVEDAYYAVHRRELGPQAMAAGVRIAQQRMSQTLAANAKRPTEGAMQGSTAAADVSISPKSMTRAQREALKARARRGEKVIL